MGQIRVADWVSFPLPMTQHPRIDIDGHYTPSHVRKRHGEEPIAATQVHYVRAGLDSQLGAYLRCATSRYLASPWLGRSLQSFFHLCAHWIVSPLDYPFIDIDQAWRGPPDEAVERWAMRPTMIITHLG